MTLSPSPLLQPRRNLKRASSRKPTRCQTVCRWLSVWFPLSGQRRDHHAGRIHLSVQVKCGPLLLCGNVALCTDRLALRICKWERNLILFAYILLLSLGAAKRTSCSWCLSWTASSTRSPRSSGRTWTRRRSLTIWRLQQYWSKNSWKYWASGDHVGPGRDDRWGNDHWVWSATGWCSGIT